MCTLPGVRLETVSSLPATDSETIASLPSGSVSMSW